MKKIFFLALLLQFSFIVMPAWAQIDSAQTADDNMSHHYDKEQNIYYDYQAVYDFINDYSEVKNKISAKEWQDLQKGKYNKLLNIHNNIYTGVQEFSKRYTHNGISVDYTDDLVDIKIIGKVFYRANRLPQSMQNKQYFLDKFSIKGLSQSASSIKLFSDASVMIAVFKGNKLVSLEIEYNMD